MRIEMEKREVIKLQRITVVAKFIKMSIFTAGRSFD